jgi:hypothetical protein
MQIRHLDGIHIVISQLPTTLFLQCQRRHRREMAIAGNAASQPRNMKNAVIAVSGFSRYGPTPVRIMPLRLCQEGQTNSSKSAIEV